MNHRILIVISAIAVTDGRVAFAQHEHHPPAHVSGGENEKKEKLPSKLFVAKLNAIFEHLKK